MSTIEQSIEIGVPVGTAYNQWTQFEEFPEFMEGVEEVEQLDDRRLRWKTSMAGQSREWEAEITEQKPDQRIAWHSTSGAEHAGVVTFHRLDDERCRVMLQMKYAPQGTAEQAASALGMLERRVKQDLEKFKEFIESRGKESGAWRGEIDPPPSKGD